MSKKKVIGDPIVIGGRKLSLSRAIRAGDLVFLTGQVPFKDGQVMTTGTVEEQTRAVLDDINAVYGEYFPDDPPARSAVISELLVDVRVEVEVVAYKPVAG
jgi:2-iminobutanoate/2-iminopropanoate deaminase